MSKLDPQELQARLEALRSGPWMERSMLARESLSVPDIELSDVKANPVLDLASLSLGPRAQAIQKKLKVTFKWHRIGRIPTHTEQEVRESFDHALSQLQMMELAIETGYLPAEQVADLARNEFVSLLWAEPARSFVRTYNYTQIEALASRLNIAGLARHRVRSVDPRGAVHFASFLATHRALQRDHSCNVWLGFLDDYIIRRNEQANFYEFLTSGEPARSQRRLELLLGARNFSVMLADFFSTLPPHLLARFGNFYSYWLAKMFGHELNRGRYVRDPAWGRGKESWGRALQNWYRQQAQRDEDDADLISEEVLMDRSLAVLATTWALVRSPSVALQNPSPTASPERSQPS